MTHLLVVIEDDNHVLVQEAGVVHGLVSHSSRDGPVADDGNGVVLAALVRHRGSFRCQNESKSRAESVGVGFGGPGNLHG